MFGRRGPVEAVFTNVELREMGELENAQPIVDLDQLPEEVVAPHMSDRDLRLRKRNIETLRSFADVDGEGKRKRVHFRFFCSPVEFLGGDRIEGVRMEKTRVEDGRAVPTGETFEVPCGMAITCIGSRAEAIDSVPFDDRRGIVIHEDGRVRDGLYAAGWVKRGAVGTIGTNKNDSLDVVEKVIAEFSGDEKNGPGDFDRIAAERRLRVVSYPEWQVIDRLEEEAAPDGAPRRKFPTPDAMLDALDANGG